jgi:hypothetical protein
MMDLEGVGAVFALVSEVTFTRDICALITNLSYSAWTTFAGF